jgi:hypothetical protein
LYLNQTKIPFLSILKKAFNSKFPQTLSWTFNRTRPPLKQPEPLLHSINLLNIAFAHLVFKARSPFSTTALMEELFKAASKIAFIASILTIVNNVSQDTNLLQISRDVFSPILILNFWLIFKMNENIPTKKIKKTY